MNNLQKIFDQRIVPVGRGPRLERMLIHAALYRWKDGVSAEEISALLAEVESLRGSIPEIVEITVGENGSGVAAGYSHGVVVLFADQAALTRYREHPAHRRLADHMREALDSVIGLDLDPGERQS